MSPRITATSPECLRVLVVDDHHDTADSCAQLVQLWQHDVRVAYDGSTALELVRSYQPHVVLLDLEMPGIDSHEVYRQIRGLAGAAVTVLALGGHGQKPVQDRAMAEGFFCYLVKPVEPRRLEALLAMLKSNRPGKLSAASTDTVK